MRKVSVKRHPAYLVFFVLQPNTQKTPAPAKVIFSPCFFIVIINTAPGGSYGGEQTEKWQ